MPTTWFKHSKVLDIVIISYCSTNNIGQNSVNLVHGQNLESFMVHLLTLKQLNFLQSFWSLVPPCSTSSPA